MDLYEYPVEPLRSEDEIAKDVETIRNAVKGFGTDEKALISVFGNRTANQMAQIVKAYKANRGENLIDVIKKECSGNFERILVALCKSAIEFECELIESHLKLVGTDEEAILKVLLCKSNEDLEELKKKFKELYNKDLESQLVDRVGGGSDVKRIFVSLLQCARKDGDVTADDIAAFPENIFTYICTKSEVFLRQLFLKHNEQGGKSVEDLIKKKFSGQAETLLLLMCSSILNKPRFYARLFEDTMKGLGTKENELNHLIVRCREPALVGAIKIAYADQFEKTLESRIKGEVSGDYEKLLVTILERGKAVKKA